MMERKPHAAKPLGISLERWSLYVGSMRRINPGPWQTSIGPAPRPIEVADTPGLREPEQDKAPPRTGQRPDQEHKNVHGFEQHAVIVGKAVKRHLARFAAG